MSKKNQPLVSIILPSYNYEKYVGETIRSVLNQTYENFELVIIENASRDSSLKVIKKFKDSRIRLYTLKENIKAEVFNYGFERCRGKYLANIHADDLFFPQKIEKQINFLEKNRYYDLCATHVQGIDEHGDIYDSPECPAWWFNHNLDLSQIESYIAVNRVCMPSVVMRREVFEEVGKLRSELNFTADLDYWVRCALEDRRIKLLEEPLVYYRRHKKNSSVSNAGQSVAELCYYFVSYLREELNRIEKHHLVVSYVENFLNNRHIKKYSKRKKANLLNCLFGLQLFEGNLDDFVRCLNRKIEGNSALLSTFIHSYTARVIELAHWVSDVESNYYNLLRNGTNGSKPVNGKKRIGIHRNSRKYKNVRWLERTKTAVVFGSGGGGLHSLRLAQQAGWDVSYLVDNNKNTWGSKINGYDIRDPRVLKNRDFDVIIVASTTGKHAIYKKLNSWKFSFGKDFIYFLDLVYNGEEFVQIQI